MVACAECDVPAKLGRKRSRANARRRDDRVSGSAPVLPGDHGERAVARQRDGARNPRLADGHHVVEEELEVLYDAYYEELEQYANHQQDVGPILPPSRYTHTLSSMPPSRHMMRMHPPSRFGALADGDSQDEDEEGDEEEYSEDEDDDYISEDEPMDLPRGAATDFCNFGNSLTVKGIFDPANEMRSLIVYRRNTNRRR